jgi:hypothetical protein
MINIKISHGYEMDKQNIIYNRFFFKQVEKLIIVNKKDMCDTYLKWASQNALILLI